MGSGEIGRQTLLKVVGTAVLVTVTGCSTPPISDGRLAPTDKLTELTVGSSGKDDVRMALGEPRGPGATRHGRDRPDLRTIWYYEFVQIKGDQIGLKILLVFFDQEKYDGYLWFGANELFERGAW
jgi:outer membrane protein assembly factor BamE (lipoprotein component of BamABCDE complex)